MLLVLLDSVTAGTVTGAVGEQLNIGKRFSIEVGTTALS
jgi:hypothetical protein